eukprot:Skav232803  [mRNA]  locus=scaffold614:375181:378706:- [translate_table: standard]
MQAACCLTLPDVVLLKRDPTQPHRGGIRRLRGEAVGEVGSLNKEQADELFRLRTEDIPNRKTGRVHVQLDDCLKALRPRNLKVMRSMTEVNDMMDRVLQVFERFLA